jgi:flagellar motor protein MotB
LANRGKGFKFTTVAYFISSPKVGRSQGASIFWGLISVCFAAAACYYFWKNHENETKANVLRDQVLQLTEENDSLTSQTQHLQTDKAEAENQLKAREDLVQEKETQLAGEETQIEGMGHQTQVQSQQNLAQVAMVRKFNDAIRKLSPDLGTDVVERGGRPVLRIPNAHLFAAGDPSLTPEGKTLLMQLAQAIGSQLDTFELRVVCYTDADAEDTAKKAADNNLKTANTASWDLTSARAAALSQFYRNQTGLPFLNVLIVARGNAEQVVAGSKDDQARNRRVEMTVTPLPVPFHAPDPDKPKAAATTGSTGGTGATTSASTDSSSTSTPAANPSSPAKKAKKADATSSTGSTTTSSIRH